MDFVYLLVGVIFFALCWALVKLCESLGGPQ